MNDVTCYGTYNLSYSIHICTQYTLILSFSMMYPDSYAVISFAFYIMCNTTNQVEHELGTADVFPIENNTTQVKSIEQMDRVRGRF